MNVAFISHCDFRGNSAMHIYSIASQLVGFGLDCIVCVPFRPGTLREFGPPSFRAVTWDEARHAPASLTFRDGRGPDLIHAWTPREGVRKLTEEMSRRFEAPYLVHLEDNEDVLLRDTLRCSSDTEVLQMTPEALRAAVGDLRVDPRVYRGFMERAAGITAIIDRLLEFAPARVPMLVFWPGFDPSFENLPEAAEIRRTLGLPADEHILAYTGNVHQSNLEEVSSLVLAVAALRRRSVPVRLLKTGKDICTAAYFDRGRRDGWIDELGFLHRRCIPLVLACSDVLVQPGRTGVFNDYRFPSKLPEYLVSGRPVILPKANIGRMLEDGENCLLLENGHALEIAAKVEWLLASADRAAHIGAGGRAFAQRELSWEKAARQIQGFYEQLAASSNPRNH